MIWVAAYFAVAVFMWGAFMRACKDMPNTNFVMALIWPVAVLLVAGSLMVERDR